MARKSPLLLQAFRLTFLSTIMITAGHSAPMTKKVTSDKSVLSASSSPSSSSLLAVSAKPITLAFPPLHCLKDSDCIGKNGTSKIFYDPNARCDIHRSVCVCRDSRYKRVQLKVNIKNSVTGNHHQQESFSANNKKNPTNSNSNTNNNNNNNNHHGHQTIYVSKCLPYDANGTPVDSGTTDESITIVVRPNYYGQPCDDDRQCSANMICRQLIVTATTPTTTKITNGTAVPSVNLAQMLNANRTKRCRCPMGQHWNKHIRRCDWLHSNSLFQFGTVSVAGGDHHDGHQSSYHTHHGVGAGIGIVGGSHGGSGSVGSMPPSVHIAASNIDLKIFEIVLEIAFLVACLLGYKACSSFCCKDDQNDPATCAGTTEVCYGSGDERDSSTFGGRGGTEVKSDEESILSSSAMKSSGANISKGRNSVPSLMTMKNSTVIADSKHGSHRSLSRSATSASTAKSTRRQSRKRRMSKFYSRATARRSSTSPYGGLSYYGNGSSQNFRRLSSVSASAMSHSSSASTRNLLVKINPSDTDASKKLSVSTILAPAAAGGGTPTRTSSSRTPSPCYNCRIYKEVYSPSARCKSCRTSLLSVATSTADLNDHHHHRKNHQQTNNNNNALIDFDSLMLMVGQQNGNGGVTTTPQGSSTIDRLSPSTSSSLDSANNNNLTTAGNLKSGSSVSSIVGAVSPSQSQLPPLSPYKQKPIRRSEEVGVPPHLRAPYRDSQPFWLK